MIERKQHKCFVTGANGVVGLPLARELRGRGFAVKVLLRDESQRALFDRETVVVKGDLSDAAALETGCDGTDFVFHLAAKLHINNPAADLRGEYDETNVAGTARLLAAAQNNNVAKLVFFSTINVYGASDGGAVFDENSNLNPNGLYAESKAAAEKLVLAARRNDGGEQFGVVLRCAAVYGSRMKGNYTRLLDALRRKRFFFVGDGANRRTLIHQEDAARAAILAAETARGGSIYNLTDGQIHTFAEIVAAMARSLNQSLPRLKIPRAPVSLGVNLAETAGNLIGVKSPINRALLDKLLEDIAVSNEKMRRELRFTAQFNLLEGWRETVLKGEKVKG